MSEKVTNQKGPSRRLLLGALGLAGVSAAAVKFTEWLNEPETEEGFRKRFFKFQTPDEHREKVRKSFERKPRNPETRFSNEEIDDIIWNVFNEAKSEPREGQLGTMLCVIDRMLHKNNPSTATGVIYKRNQFSWVREVRFPVPRVINNPELKLRLSERFRKFKDKNGVSNEEYILNIRKLVLEFLSGKTVGDARKKIVEEISKITGIKIPEKPGVLFYKRTDWNHRNLNEKRLSSNSKRIFTKIEDDMLARGQKPILLGAHTFYTADDF